MTLFADNTKRFVCLKCGRCCDPSNPIYSFIETEEKQFEAVLKRAEEGPLYYSKKIPPGIPILDFEKDELEKEAQQRKLKIELLPLHFYFDYKTRFWIVLAWMLKAPCPFLESKTCLIYQKRPLSCKGWPLVGREGTALIDVNCPSVPKKLVNELLTDKKRPTQFFWEQFIALNQNTAFFIWLESAVKELAKQEKILPVGNVTKEYIENNLAPKKIQGLFEFLKEQDLIPSKEFVMKQLWHINSKKEIEKDLKHKMTNL